MPDDDRHSGIPTRAIHEAYLDMHRALKRYRRATDNASKQAIDQAHGEVQETVLTLYELLRPHIKHSDGVSDYWEGEPPSYPHKQGETPDSDDGRAVLEVQRRKETFQIPAGQADEFANAETLEDWHDLLNLNGDVRLTGVHEENGIAFVAYDAYQLGMRQLDDWQTDYQTVTENLDGFLEGTTEEKTRRKRNKIHKLKRAARELSDVAKELGFLPQSEIPDNEDPIPI